MLRPRNELLKDRSPMRNTTAARDVPIASVVITTKNRRDELFDAVSSAISQSVPVEVLVIDDGSTDGTAEMVRTQFPSVRLEQSKMSLGYIVQRNRAAQLASGRFVFSIDDDAIFRYTE